MSDLIVNAVLPPIIMPFPEPQRKEFLWPVPMIYDHGPGNYCFYCSCDDCRMFFANGKPIQCVDPRSLEPLTPRYNYLGLVNNMRIASAKREEERQERLQAERNGKVSVIKSPKKDKVTKTPKKKTLRQSNKRRRV